MPPSRCNPMTLAGRRILVTGASAGIGQAIAVLLSRLGASVICAGRDADRLQQTLAALEGGGHTAQPFDLTAVAGIPKWLESVAAAHGALYGMVHSAGVQATLPLKLTKQEKWREIMQVNTEAALALAQAFPDRKVRGENEGAIVFISSVMGLVGAAGRTAYALSKSALHGLTRALVIELAPRRIRVNCVAPGAVRTAMYAEAEKNWTEEQRSQVERLHPLGLGQPEDVANAVAFLLSDAARWITGTILTVDGGYTAQ